MTDSALLSGLVIVLLLGLLAGLMMRRLGQGVRHRRGLGDGETVALDNVTLTSARLGLTGRPDRLIRQAGTVIVEEWKSARTVRLSHRAQMGVYFLLVAEQWGVVPSHGFIVLGDGKRVRIDNSERLRSWVLGIAGQIRQADARTDRPIAVDVHAGRCRACGMRGHCSQVLL